jgi:hypothetical protein
MASQNPTSFNFNQMEGTFTFLNEQVTIVGQTNFPSEPLTVESVTLENPGLAHPLDLGITNVEVPPALIEHAPELHPFDLLI